MGREANVREAHAYNRRILKDTRRRTVPAKPSFDPQRALQLAYQTFDIESQALLGLKTRQGESFTRAVGA